MQEFLGGNPEMEGDEVFYRNRFSVHLQGIVNAEFVEPTIYLRTVPAQFDPSRVAFVGPGPRRGRCGRRDVYPGTVIKHLALTQVRCRG